MRKDAANMDMDAWPDGKDNLKHKHAPAATCKHLNKGLKENQTEDTSGPENVTEDTSGPENVTEDTSGPENVTEDTSGPENVDNTYVVSYAGCIHLVYQQSY